MIIAVLKLKHYWRITRFLLCRIHPFTMWQKENDERKKEHNDFNVLILTLVLVEAIYIYIYIIYFILFCFLFFLFEEKGFYMYLLIKVQIREEDFSQLRGSGMYVLLGHLIVSPFQAHNGDQNCSSSYVVENIRIEKIPLHRHWLTLYTIFRTLLSWKKKTLTIDWN